MQDLYNQQLFQVMVLSESDTAGQVLKNMTKLQTEIERLQSFRVEDDEMIKDLDKELQETLELLVNSLYESNGPFLTSLINMYVVRKTLYINWIRRTQRKMRGTNL